MRPRRIGPPMADGAGVVDVAVNHLYAAQADLADYLPAGYRERFEEYGQPLVGARGLENAPGFDALCAAVDPPAAGGGSAGVAPPRFVSERLPDAVEAALLVGSEPFYAPNSTPNLDYADALCRAYNDYTLDRWLPADDRFRYVLVVNHGDPAAAAEEVDRVGDHPRVVGVLLSPRTDRPFGNKAYDPIHEASERAGLPLVLRPTYAAAGTHGHPQTPAGYSTDPHGRRAIRPGQVQAHLHSLVYEGTFEKFPDLAVAAVGWGWTWLPAYLWRLDSEWKNLHTEVPWVERPPSEYVAEHVRFDLRPATAVGGDDYLEAVFDWVDAADLLMYGSEFPRRSGVDPEDVLPSRPQADRRKVLAGNARALFGLA